uniref:Uncharacterized protein n=1 Tax=Anguilla anguilla TaxID=7936 RepID=A0A0E9R2S8_ANGAN
MGLYGACQGTPVIFLSPLRAPVLQMRMCTTAKWTCPVLRNPKQSKALELSFLFMFSPLP